MYRTTWEYEGDPVTIGVFDDLINAIRCGIRYSETHERELSRGGGYRVTDPHGNNWDEFDFPYYDF